LHTVAGAAWELGFDAWGCDDLGAHESLLVVSGTGSGDGVFHLVHDFQGSWLALADAGGSVLERYRYSPFGEVSVEDAAGNPLAASAHGVDRFFPGRPFDALTGLYDLRARWYDPAPGAFLSPDPLGFHDS